ncbi:MAG: acyl-CoA thioesterase [Chitinophagaceae bacterium]|nr:MAG: acyl-CoA thioesterase [Chitinophagaceae bacterium]
MNYLKSLESKKKIRFHDCDPFNHLNNARYIDYIVTARGDQLLDYYGLDIYELARTQGLAWVTAQTQIAYLAPAYLMEEVTIQTRLLLHAKKSLLLEGLMWNEEKTILKSVMWTKLVHFHLPTAQSHPHSDKLMELFDQIADPPPLGTDFETRTKNLRLKK